MVPVDSVRVSRDPTYSGALLALNRVSPTGLSPSAVKLSSLFSYAINYIYCRSYNPEKETLSVWAIPVSLAATKGMDFSFSSSGYLDVSVHQVYVRIPGS